jgi:hypothetical protein
MLVKEILENNRGGHRINPTRSAQFVISPFGQMGPSDLGGQSFIDAMDGQTGVFDEVTYEGVDLARFEPGCSIHIQGIANHQVSHPPILDHGFDPGKAFKAIIGCDGRKRRSHPEVVTITQTDAAFTKIEAETAHT